MECQTSSTARKPQLANNFKEIANATTDQQHSRQYPKIKCSRCSIYMLLNVDKFQLLEDSRLCFVVGKLLEIRDYGTYFSFVLTDGSGVAGFVLLKGDRISYVDKMGIEEGRYLRLGVRIRTSVQQQLLFEIMIVRVLDNPNQISLHFAEIILQNMPAK